MGELFSAQEMMGMHWGDLDAKECACARVSRRVDGGILYWQRWVIVGRRIVFVAGVSEPKGEDFRCRVLRRPCTSYSERMSKYLSGMDTSIFILHPCSSSDLTTSSKLCTYL